MGKRQVVLVEHHAPGEVRVTPEDVDVEVCVVDWDRLEAFGAARRWEVFDELAAVLGCFGRGARGLGQRVSFVLETMDALAAAWGRDTEVAAVRHRSARPERALLVELAGEEMTAVHATASVAVVPVDWVRLHRLLEAGNIAAARRVESLISDSVVVLPELPAFLSSLEASVAELFPATSWAAGAGA